MKSKFVFLITVVFGVYLILYFLLQVLSVNTVLTMIGQNSDENTQRAIERQFRLDLPPWKRLAIHLNDLSPISFYSQEIESVWYNQDVKQSGLNFLNVYNTGLWLKVPYFGRSFQNQELVADLVWTRLKTTFILAFISIILASFIGIILGIMASTNYQKWPDQLILVFSSLGVSVPSFFIAIILSMTLGYFLSDFTGLSFKGSLVEYDDIGNAFFSWRNLILPVFALSFRPLAIITQMTRNSMLDTLKEDYIRTALAKGLSVKTVVWKHGLVNALNPVVSSIAGWFGSLLAGAYFIEIIFDMKGLGALTVNALMKFDVPVVLGASLYMALLFVMISFLLDLAYRWLDPRVGEN
jgi:peptide/nickel transport system permease protein